MSSDDELLDPWMARVYSAVVDKMVVNYGNNQHYICRHPSVETVDIAGVTPFARRKSIYPWDSRALVIVKRNSV
jgi:hypothetical protein